MRQLIRRTNLRDLFKIPRDHSLTENDIRYHSSLIPNLSILEKTKAINFKVTLGNPSKINDVELLHHNSVNSHIFKPKYFQQDKEILTCFVSSREMLTHTLRSLALINHIYYKKDIWISALDALDKYEYYSDSWKINSRILIGRVESVINFLRMQWLLENGVLKNNDLQDLFREIELTRLNNENKIGLIENKYLGRVGVSFDEIDKNLKLEIFKSRSPYIGMANFEVSGTSISVVQLPWGYSMTIQMMKFLLAKRDIEKIGIVGGVGYLGGGKARIDDIFYPENLILVNGKAIAMIPIGNRVFDLPPKNYFFKKNIVRGNIFSVVPRLGRISYTKHIRDLDSIHAYDMEKAAFVKKIKDSSKISMASCYYIMDFPYTKLDLGGTYYSYDFLKKLFNTKNRGKYYCFERILYFLMI